MPTLLFRGFDSDNCSISGSGSFASEEQLREHLQKSGINNADIFPSKTVYSRRVYSQVSPKELSVFCRQMSVLFFSNITLMEGVWTLADQADNRPLKLTLGEIYDFMDQGYTFAEAIGMYEHIFSPYLLHMIRIGEASGTLDVVFEHMSTYFDKEYALRKKVHSAVVYPAVLAVLMTAVIALLIVKILPVFSDILESMGAQLPSVARSLMQIGTFLVVYAPVLVIAVLLLYFVCRSYIRTDNGRRHFDRVKLSLPVYNYVQARINAARFARSLAIMLKSGATLSTALESVAALMDNRCLEEQIMAAADKVKSGDDPVAALSQTGFPPLFLKLFVIGYKAGNLDELLDKSATVFDDEADDAIKRFTDLLEPLLIVMLSAVIGVIMLSVMLPTIAIMNSIG